MKKAFASFLLLAAGLGAQTLSSEAVIEPLLPDRKGPPPVRAFVSSGDRLIPQIATGGDGRNGFFMIFEVFNISDQMVDVTVGFLDERAQLMMLPVQGLTGDQPGFRTTLKPGASVFARTLPTGATKIGYAIVGFTPEPASSELNLPVGINAIFNQVVPGRPVFQAGIPVSTGAHDRFFVPFLNTGGFTGTLAMVSVLAQRVTFIAHGVDGAELCRSTRLMGQLEHLAGVISQLLSCTANVNGSLEVRADLPGLSGIGFLAQDDGAFVTQPVFGQLRLPATP